MNKEELYKVVLDVLCCNPDRIEEREIADINAYYFRNTDRGGGAVIISDNGEFLLVDPFFVDYEEHLKQFKNGKRTVLPQE